MKAINLHALLSLYERGHKQAIKQYLRYASSQLKEHEWRSLRALRDYLAISTSERGQILDAFFVGYSIPQIGKEFDLIKLGISPEGEKVIINIELKSEANREKIERQLRRNYYYLKATTRHIELFTFVESEQALYTLVQGQLQTCPKSKLLDILRRSIPDRASQLYQLFDPKHYLISPFEQTQSFMQDEYFLTTHQEMIEQKLLSWAEDSSCRQFAAIEGAAGTGKTLLTYHIVRRLQERGYRVLILHCASLNRGQEELIRQHAWHILDIKALSQIESRVYDIIIVDEAQRLDKIALGRLIKLGYRCLFSYDPIQEPSSSRERGNIKQLLQKIVVDNKYRLTTSIRSNKEIVGFISQILDKRRVQPISTDCIEICTFYSREELHSYLHYLSAVGWIIPQYNQETEETQLYSNKHLYRGEHLNKLIGLEYDGVVAVLDEHFYYNTKGRLCSRSIAEEHSDDLKTMFYQIVTRARKRLCIIILNNDVLLERCLAILRHEEP